MAIVTVFGVWPASILVSGALAPLILYSSLAKGPKLGFDDQVNSTRHFLRELNRLGITSTIDAGGGFQSYPDEKKVIGLLVANRWPFRLHATYDKSISRFLNVFDEIDREIPFKACAGFSTMPRPSRSGAWNGSRHWKEGSPSKTAWPSRVNTL